MDSGRVIPAVSGKNKAVIPAQRLHTPMMSKGKPFPKAVAVCKLVINGAKIPPILLQSEQDPNAVLRTEVGNISLTCRKTTAKAAEVANFPMLDMATIGQEPIELGMIKVERQARPERIWVPAKIGLRPSLSRVKAANKYEGISMATPKAMLTWGLPPCKRPESVR